MMNLATVVDFIESHGDTVEQARLAYLLENQPPSKETIRKFQSTQREDGGWAPFWAPDYSSLDATCFRLAQAKQLGLDSTMPYIANAIHFLAKHQQEDGSWEEGKAVADLAPPWAKPGETSARLYLTANCGYWLAMSNKHTDAAVQGANFLAAFLDENGRLPSYLVAHWLSGGLWYRLNLMEKAESVLNYLATRLELSASNLAWLITSLRIAHVPANYPLIEGAVSRLMQLQLRNGRWQSDDGAEYDVHATLEALHALKLCERV